MRRDQFVAAFQRQHSARVGQRMDQDRGVLACLHDLVEIADRAAADGPGQRAVMPLGLPIGEEIAAGEVGRRHVLMRGDGDQRTVEPPGHVLDEARLAAAGRAFQHHRQALLPRRLENRDFVGDRLVEQLGWQAIVVDVHE